MASASSSAGSHEGVEESEWVLLDYFNFVVHVFSRDCRSFYGLERLWGNAVHHEYADWIMVLSMIDDLSIRIG
jgi:ribosomal silencing factor RsfS